MVMNQTCYFEINKIISTADNNFRQRNKQRVKTFSDDIFYESASETILARNVKMFM